MFRTSWDGDKIAFYRINTLSRRLDVCEKSKKDVGCHWNAGIVFFERAGRKKGNGMKKIYVD